MGRGGGSGGFLEGWEWRGACGDEGRMNALGFCVINVGGVRHGFQDGHADGENAGGFPW